MKRFMGCLVVVGLAAGAAFGVPSKTVTIKPVRASGGVSSAAADDAAGKKPEGAAAPVEKTAPPAGPLQITKAENGKVLSVAAGQDVGIRLAGNITTGYEWVLVTREGAVLEGAGAGTYEQNKAEPGMVGVGGEFVFKFRAAKPGKAKLTFAYQRPWEKKVAPAETFSVTVSVE